MTCCGAFSLVRVLWRGKKWNRYGVLCIIKIWLSFACAVVEIYLLWLICIFWEAGCLVVG